MSPAAVTCSVGAYKVIPSHTEVCHPLTPIMLIRVMGAGEYVVTSPGGDQVRTVTYGTVWHKIAQH